MSTFRWQAYCWHEFLGMLLSSLSYASNNKAVNWCKVTLITRKKKDQHIRSRNKNLFLAEQQPNPIWESILRNWFCCCSSMFNVIEMNKNIHFDTGKIIAIICSQAHHRFILLCLLLLIINLVSIKTCFTLIVWPHSDFYRLS